MVNFSETVAISSSTTNLVDYYAPFTLTLEPKFLLFENKVRAIEYIWGDGTKTYIDYKPSLVNNGNLPFPNDVGSPLNYPQNHIYFSKDLFLSVYDIKINVYFFGTNYTRSFDYRINLKNPDLQGTLSSYFSEFHLIKTRMFGPDNKLLYTFQTQNPDYILMTTVNWKTIPIQKLNQNSVSVRPYKFISPIEYPFTTTIPENTAINIVKYNPKVPINLDSGVVY